MVPLETSRPLVMTVLPFQNFSIDVSYLSGTGLFRNLGSLTRKFTTSLSSGGSVGAVVSLDISFKKKCFSMR